MRRILHFVFLPGIASLVLGILGVVLLLACVGPLFAIPGVICGHLAQSRIKHADGMLTGWTLDLGTARRLGMVSTGSASRGTSAPPSPGNGNLTLSQGDQSPQALLSAMGTGLLVTGFLGASVNATTGDYSRGASGYWVEGGQVAFAVNECTVAGNLRDMLVRMVPSNDARAHLSQCVPSLLIDGLMIAGQ